MNNQKHKMKVGKNDVNSESAMTITNVTFN